MSRNNDYTTGSLLDFSYHQNYYKLVGTDLSRQTNTRIPQKIHLGRKWEETIQNCSLDSWIVTE